MKHTKRKKNSGLKKITPFHIINGIFLSLLIVVCVLPIVHVIALSLSNQIGRAHV